MGAKIEAKRAAIKAKKEAIKEKKRFAKEQRQARKDLLKAKKLMKPTLGKVNKLGKMAKSISTQYAKKAKLAAAAEKAAALVEKKKNIAEVAVDKAKTDYENAIAAVQAAQDRIVPL